MMGSAEPGCALSLRIEWDASCFELYDNLP